MSFGLFGRFGFVVSGSWPSNPCGTSWLSIRTSKWQPGTLELRRQILVVLKMKGNKKWQFAIRKCVNSNKFKVDLTTTSYPSIGPFIRVITTIDNESSSWPILGLSARLNISWTIPTRKRHHSDVSEALARTQPEVVVLFNIGLESLQSTNQRPSRKESGEAIWIASAVWVSNLSEEFAWFFGEHEHVVYFFPGAFCRK